MVGERDGLSLSPDGTHLVAVQSLRRNQANAGFLVGWLDGRAQARALAGDPRDDTGAMQAHLVDEAGVAFRPEGAPEGLGLPRGAHAVPDDGRMVELVDPSIRSGRPTLVSRIRVPARPLFLVHVVEAGDLFRAVPSESAAAYLAAGAALVLGAVGLAVFLNVRSLVRRTRQEESSARERELGEKDEALEREAAERQRVERSRAVLANALEQSADAVAITDIVLRIEHVNPAFERAHRSPGEGAPRDGRPRRAGPRGDREPGRAAARDVARARGGLARGAARGAAGRNALRRQGVRDPGPGRLRRGDEPRVLGARRHRGEAGAGDSDATPSGWRPSGRSPAAWPTTSTTSSPRSTATRRWPPTPCLPTTRSGRTWRRSGWPARGPPT